jgi:uncharacterized protein
MIFSKHCSILLFSTAILLASCITVNVNFPEAAVQQASDSYVEQLYRMREEAEKQKSPGSKESPTRQGAGFHFSPWHLFVPMAFAADQFRVESELITQIQRREVQRLAQLDRFKTEGLIGENNQGLLVPKGEPKALQKKRVDELINQENTDRELLYREVLRINGMDSGQMKTVTTKFANSFQSKSPKGSWVQQANGQWIKK